MLQGILWILLCYGLSIATVHLAHFALRRRVGKDGLGNKRHYFIICNHHQLQIEWILRSLVFWSWLKGRTSFVTVLDEGSTDDTVRIVDRLARVYPIRLVHGSMVDIKSMGNTNEDTVIFNLNHTEDVRNLSLV